MMAIDLDSLRHLNKFTILLMGLGLFHHCAPRIFRDLLWSFILFTTKYIVIPTTYSLQRSVNFFIVDRIEDGPNKAHLRSGDLRISNPPHYVLIFLLLTLFLILTISYGSTVWPTTKSV